MTVILEGKYMTTREATHEHLVQRLKFPDYYGRNLDALYDLLMEISEESEIALIDPALVTAYLGKYGEALLSTIQEAAEENPNLIVIPI